MLEILCIKFEVNKVLLKYSCLGCKLEHIIPATNDSVKGKKEWLFNDNYDKPTLTPSVLCKFENERSVQICHRFITDGQIGFLSDCSHNLVGKRLPTKVVNFYEKG